MVVASTAAGFSRLFAYFVIYNRTFPVRAGVFVGRVDYFVGRKGFARHRRFVLAGLAERIVNRVIISPRRLFAVPHERVHIEIKLLILPRVKLFVFDFFVHFARFIIDNADVIFVFVQPVRLAVKFKKPVFRPEGNGFIRLPIGKPHFLADGPEIGIFKLVINVAAKFSALFFGESERVSKVAAAGKFRYLRRGKGGFYHFFGELFRFFVGHSLFHSADEVFGDVVQNVTEIERTDVAGEFVRRAQPVFDEAFIRAGIITLDLARRNVTPRKIILRGNVFSENNLSVRLVEKPFGVRKFFSVFPVFKRAQKRRSRR